MARRRFKLHDLLSRRERIELAKRNETSTEIPELICEFLDCWSELEAPDANPDTELVGLFVNAYETLQRRGQRADPKFNDKLEMVLHALNSDSS